MLKSYKSVEDILRGEAQVFIDRSKMYLDKGELDKAIDCLNKAMVKIKRADVLKLSPLEEKMFGPLMMLEVVEESSLEGLPIGFAFPYSKRIDWAECCRALERQGYKITKIGD